MNPQRLKPSVVRQQLVFERRLRHGLSGASLYQPPLVNRQPLGIARQSDPARGEPEGIDVLFPPHVQTHCQRQQFHFGADGRIIRHDYVADVIGVWARGAHFWEGYERSEGLLIARRRRVVGRLGRRLTQLSVLCVQFGEPLVGHEPKPRADFSRSV